MVSRLNHIIRKKICSIKFTAFVVAFLMVFTVTFPATYAIAETTAPLKQPTRTVPLHDGHITWHSDGSFFVKIGDEECSIRITEARNKRTVHIKNEKNSQVDRLIFDTKAGTVFSTYTGKTINIKSVGDGSSDQGTVTDNFGEDFSGEIVRISWKQIGDSIGWLVHRTGLVGLLIGCSGGGSVALATVNAVGFILSKIGRFFLNETEHGIVVYYKTGTACHGIRSGLCIAGNKLISIRQY